MAPVRRSRSITASKSGGGAFETLGGADQAVAVGVFSHATEQLSIERSGGDAGEIGTGLA